MTKPDKKRPRIETDPIGIRELRGAIQKSGYPLEVELFHLFKDKGMATTLGTWLQIDDSPTAVAELDLVAYFRATTPLDGEKLTSYVTTVFAEVKRLHAPAQFVGILGEQPASTTEALARAHYAGLPSFGHGVYPHAQPNVTGAIFTKAGAICDTSEPLHGAPTCPHWAIVRRNKKGNEWEAFAKGDPEFYRDMQKLVAARAYWSEKIAKILLSKKGSPPAIQFIPLLLVVDTKKLFVYDPQDKTIRGVPRLVVQQTYQVGTRTCQAAIDVVIPSEVPAMIERYHESFKVLGKRVKSWDAAMQMLVDTLREKEARRVR